MIKIIGVGKIKENFLQDGISEYVKRIKVFTKLEIVEVKEVNQFDVVRNIILEGQNILDKIQMDDYVITLEINGQVIDSLNFAKKLANLYVYGKSQIVFVIGGSNGLSEEVSKRSNYQLSFSKFTFPHQLMRLILCEQIYRSLTINNNKEYHK